MTTGKLGGAEVTERGDEFEFGGLGDGLRLSESQLHAPVLEIRGASLYFLFFVFIFCEKPTWLDLELAIRVNELDSGCVLG